MTNENSQSAGAAPLSFDTLGISPRILDVLHRNKFTVPTPIQHKVIPFGVQGKDIIGIAQTGTGKTLAFGIPMIERLLANRNARGLVVLPTRELAIQVEETIHRIGSTLGISSVVLIGGESVTKQMRLLKLNPTVMIATPGRLLDHVKQGNARLDNVSIVVLDEADHMFDIGFAPQVRDIMRRVSKVRQTLLFSATMPAEIATLAMEHMKLPLRIETAVQGTSATNVEQEIIVVNRHAKFPLLSSLLAKEDRTLPVIVFSRTKHGAKDIALGLRNLGITAVEIHGNRSLGQRKEALEGFKQHRYQVLVATDIAARGIDVKDIGLVVNYDLPEQTEDYVHRIGRTGRAGKSGRAVSFATPDQKFDIVAIERLIKRPIATTHHKGAALPATAVGAPIGGGRQGGAVGGYGPRKFDRRAPVGAFKVHTNQPFKGGAPKGYVPRSAAARPVGAHAWQRPAATGGRPSYGPSRGASTSYGPKRAFNSGRPSFGSRPTSGGARPAFGVARPVSAPKPFRTDPSFVAGFKGGYQGSNPRPAGSDFKAARTGGASRPSGPYKGNGPRTGGAPRPGGSFRKSR
ncbi:MAG: DEAD/DEAH box helicase [Candidatus Paceibacterota bacterium]|jgi:ATP-dependent RNA helicase RhlE